MTWDMLIALVVAATSPAPATTATTTCAGTVNQSAYEAGRWPPACWRPYREESAFNLPIAKDDLAEDGSAEIAARLLADGPIGPITAGDPQSDYGIATYHARPEDPLRTIHCIEPWGECELEGVQVPIPRGAKPSGQWPLENPDDDWDSHLTVIDDETGLEYDLWNIRSMDSDSVDIKWGGITNVRGYGLGSDAVASQNGSIAGVIRPQELEAGQIDHALALFVPCTEGFEYPATKGGLDCSDAGLDPENRPRMGEHFRLESNRAELAAARPWKRAILKALDRYGAYVVDTSGTEGVWGLKVESPAGYTSLGHDDPLMELATKEGILPRDVNGNGVGEYFLDLASDVDWSRLEVVPPAISLP